MSKKKKLITTIYTVVILVEILGVGFFVWKWIEPTNFGYAVLFVRGSLYHSHSDV